MGQFSKKTSKRVLPTTATEKQKEDYLSKIKKVHPEIIKGYTKVDLARK